MDQLEKQINEYQALGKENKNIDVASLMLNAINSEKNNLVSAAQKKRAYWVSVLVPPFGILYALKFYFSEEDDAKRVAFMCVFLTAISLLTFWLAAKSLFSGPAANQIQNIKPNDALELVR